MARVASGDLSSAQRSELDRAIRRAEQASRLEFSVFLGPLDDDGRDLAGRLHALLSAPARSVLVAVDEESRRLEVVTGADARRVLTDAEVGLAVAAMQSSFAAGDVLGGLTRGLASLAEHARQPETLHASPQS